MENTETIIPRAELKRISGNTGLSKAVCNFFVIISLTFQVCQSFYFTSMLLTFGGKLDLFVQDL